MKQIPKQQFDDLTRSGQFKDGPFISSFGDGYGEPYQPYRRLYGTLKSGEEVESSTDPDWVPNEEKRKFEV